MKRKSALKFAVIGLAPMCYVMASCGSASDERSGAADSDKVPTSATPAVDTATTTNSGPTDRDAQAPPRGTPVPLPSVADLLTIDALATQLSSSPYYTSADIAAAASPAAWASEAAGVLSGELVTISEAEPRTFELGEPEEYSVELMELAVVLRVRTVTDTPLGSERRPLSPGTVVEIVVPVTHEPAAVVEQAKRYWIDPLLVPLEQGGEVLVAYADPLASAGANASLDLRLSRIDGLILTGASGLPNLLASADRPAFGLDHPATIEAEATEIG